MNTSEDKIQIFRALPKLSPYLEFGKVAKAVELYAQDADTYRVQIIELDRGKSFEPHIHVSDHIIYCLDGNGKINTDENCNFYTSSKKLIDDVQELLLKCGLSGNTKRHKNRNNAYRINVISKYNTPSFRGNTNHVLKYQ